MQQVKIPSWVGAIQVQLTNSFFYVSAISLGMQATTLWAVAGPSIQAVWPPARFWMLVLLAFGVLCLIMVLDYKFIYPVRQAFINEQACKHTNPAMELLLKMDEKLDKTVKEKE